MKLQSMGMAVMLDEIINYVQSLQNQVEVSQNYNSSVIFYFILFSFELQNDIYFFKY